jgi:predicted O-methyltransferase YrrM
MLHMQSAHGEVLRVAGRQHRRRSLRRSGDQTVGLRESDTPGRVLPSPFTGTPPLRETQGKNEKTSHELGCGAVLGSPQSARDLLDVHRSGAWLVAPGTERQHPLSCRFPAEKVDEHGGVEEEEQGSTDAAPVAATLTPHPRGGIVVPLVSAGSDRPGGGHDHVPAPRLVEGCGNGPADVLAAVPRPGPLVDLLHERVIELHVQSHVLIMAHWAGERCRSATIDDVEVPATSPGADACSPPSDSHTPVSAVIERLVRDGTAVARQDGSTHNLFPVAITPSEGARLREWVVSEAAQRTIEIGLGYGISTLFICDALFRSAKRGRHLAIDPHQESRFANCGLQFLDEAGVGELVELVRDESQVALPRLLEAGRTFDFAFVDGNHRFDGVFVDLIYLGRILRPGAVVFVDDYQLPAVARAASFCASNLGWTLLETSDDDDDLHQWAVLRTSVTADRRTYDHFIDF